MKNKKINIAIITNILTTYREGFYDRLFSIEDLNVTVYCQDRMPGVNVTSIHEKYGDRVKIIKFISAKKEKLAWQFLPWREIFKKYDLVFVGGNPRVLSDVLISIVLRIAGKKVVHWIMARSFRANAFTEKIRLLWSRLFKNIFVYTDAEADYLRDIGFEKHFIVGMNNGLDQKAIDAVALKWTDARLRKWRLENNLGNKVMVLSCARLNTKNKFEQVINALPLMLEKNPNLIYCIVGDGDEKNNMMEMVKSSGLENHVRFVGALYDEDELAPWFLSSELLIHPAAIGLTLMHAFGYGLPVVTHGKTKLHNPEYAAFEPECTGRNFEIDNIQSLADTVVGLLHDKDALAKMKIHVLDIVREKYNVDIMVERFALIARKAAVDYDKIV